MKRRTLLWGGGSAAALLVAAMGFARWGRPSAPGAARAPAPAAPAQEAAPAPRVVSLAPAITESLRAMGAAEHVVAVSDYCSEPGHLPRVGSAITPQYEAIARARPTLIVATAVSGTQLAPLGKLAKTVELPWLSVEDVAESLRRLGRLTGTEARADALSARFTARLSVKPADDAPRILLLLGDAGAGSASFWFLRDDSLHGALLRAAGGRNAVTKQVTGAPRLSVEELLALDPDAILLLGTDPSPEALEPPLTELRKLLPLRAVKDDALGAFADAQLLGSGPALLEFIEPLRAEINRLTAHRAP